MLCVGMQNLVGEIVVFKNNWEQVIRFFNELDCQSNFMRSHAERGNEEFLGGFFICVFCVHLRKGFFVFCVYLQL